MTYATEFFTVQDALNIENVKSVSNAPFAAIDAQYKAEGRLQDAEKQVEGFGRLRAIFVDGKMIVCELNGSPVDADQEEVKQILGL